jgi:hypothetical protein
MVKLLKEIEMSWPLRRQGDGNDQKKFGEKHDKYNLGTLPVQYQLIEKLKGLAPHSEKIISALKEKLRTSKQNIGLLPQKKILFGTHK